MDVLEICVVILFRFSSTYFGCQRLRLPLSLSGKPIPYGEPGHSICSAVSFELWRLSIRSSPLQDEKTATDKRVDSAQDCQEPEQESTYVIPLGHDLAGNQIRREV